MQLARMDSVVRSARVCHRVVVVGVDVFLDRGDEVGHEMEDPAPQRFVGR